MQCTLTPDELAVRGQRWRALGSAEATTLDDGLRLEFGPQAAEELAELAALERECCSFASWEANGSVLDITADGDAVAAVQAMFGSLRRG
jgi:hypothetical protein